MKVGEALGINDPVGQTVSGLGGAYAASRALPALAGIGLLPSAVGIATIEGIRNRVNAGIEERKRINAMSPKERAEFERQNRLKATDYMSEGVSDQDLFGKFYISIKLFVIRNTTCSNFCSYRVFFLFRFFCDLFYFTCSNFYSFISWWHWSDIS